jgi:hypothetical protein
MTTIGPQTNDEKLSYLDAEKRELLSEFRRKLSDILNREREVLGLVNQDDYEIEVYY